MMKTVRLQFDIDDVNAPKEQNGDQWVLTLVGQMLNPYPVQKVQVGVFDEEPKD